MLCRLFHTACPRLGQVAGKAGDGEVDGKVYEGNDYVKGEDGSRLEVSSHENLAGAKGFCCKVLNLLSNKVE